MKKDFKNFKEFINDKKTAVIGMGISNRPLIHFLVELGAKVTAFDKKTREELKDIVDEFEKEGVVLELGEGYLDKLNGFEVIFKTPSMRIDNPYLLKEKEAGAYITSEMEEFVRYCPAKIFGITGSDGKTTTTTLVYKMLREQGYNTWVGGNIGTPLFTQIENVNKDDKVVLELSSFQLMTMNVSPEVAVITNLSPNHLDMHKGMDEYVESKKNIFKYQNQSDLLVLNLDNDITRNMKSEAKGRVFQFTRQEMIAQGACYKDNTLYIFEQEVCKKDDIQIKGLHNVENLLAAFTAVYEDVSLENMRKVAVSFTGVEHRCEFVREIDGVKYYNDSIASSPTRTLAGLNAFEQQVILIAGGYDKNIPFEPLAEEGYKMIKALVLVGTTKYKIKEVFDKVIRDKGINLPIVLADSFEEAVYEAGKIAVKGDVVTLSPACASFDLFPNFEARGNTFKNIVTHIK
ncbi:MAG: UDP-N-acetylmuramoyl-L-alanine--D-glutamate ligase [Bacillota bacterium]|nr:UDP-N-acetylmuramoyl-L-alanine--D-glutamate ligase [Bacillota bacterium]